MFRRCGHSLWIFGPRRKAIAVLISILFLVWLLISGPVLPGKDLSGEPLFTTDFVARPISHVDQAEHVSLRGIQTINQGEHAVRGIPVESQAKFAAQRVNGVFVCSDGSREFADTAVNDDFCDCPDGSDEPGTSACAGLPAVSLAKGWGFACNWWQPALTVEIAGGGHIDNIEAVWGILVRHSAVNDGICDCCAGEDEWHGVVVCPDRCQEEETQENVHLARARDGAAAREKYVKMAPAFRYKPKFRSVDGGPDGVFLAAAQQCYNLDDTDFTYKLCLFDKVVQKRKGHETSLGKDGKWATHLWEDGKTLRNDYTRFIMEDGEYCWASKQKRRAEIIFECSPEPALTSVQEMQVCVYTFVLQTPAGCNANLHGPL